MTKSTLDMAMEVVTKDPSSLFRYGEMCVIEGYNAAVAKVEAVGPLYKLVDGEFVQITFAKCAEEDRA